MMLFSKKNLRKIDCAQQEKQHQCGQLTISSTERAERWMLNGNVPENMKISSDPKEANDAVARIASQLFPSSQLIKDGEKRINIAIAYILKNQKKIVNKRRRTSSWWPR